MTGTETQRQQALDDLRALVDFLAAHPDVPLGYRDPLDYSVPDFDSDAEALEHLGAIAETLGVEVTDVGGRPPKDATTHFYARKTIGAATYEAAYVIRAHMAEYVEEQAWVRERRAAVTA
jgi:hypothetical protein